MKTKNQPKQKIEKLIKQYPALKKIIEWAQDVSQNQDGITPIVDIRVNRADENLMMFCGEHIDGINTSILGENQTIGTKRQTVYFITFKEEDGICISWHKGVSSRIKDIFGFSEGTSPEHLKYLILVTVYNYYEEIEDWYRKGLKNRMGKLVSKEIIIQLYLPPKKSSFTELLKRVDPMTNIELNIKDIMVSMSREDHIYKSVLEVINKLVDRFVNEVYLKGMKDVIDASTKKGMKGQFGSVEVLSYVIAGRIMFTFNKDKDSITFIGVEKEIPPGMGLHSIEATLPKAKEIIEEVIENWKNSGVPISEKMKEDAKVRMAGF